MKSQIALIALIAALPGFAMAQSVTGSGVGGFNNQDANNTNDNDGSVIADGDVDGDIINLDFDDVFDVDDDFVDEGNFNIAENLISIDDLTVEYNLGIDISGALDAANIAGTVMTASAVNSASIDGSINITSIGQSATTANEAADGAFNAGLTNGLLADNDLVDGNVVDQDEISLAGLTLGTSEVTSAANTATASMQVFGDVSSVAAGALNTADFTLVETASKETSSAAGTTLTTTADAADELMSGSGLLVMGDSLNTATIDGSITANLDGGDLNFTSIGSVAAGALNTVTVNATTVGRSVQAPTILWDY